jgi:hypothetical protein
VYFAKIYNPRLFIKTHLREMIDRAKQSGFTLNISCFKEAGINEGHDIIIDSLKEMLKGEKCTFVTI